jgi:hypothetical protein
MLYRSKTLRVLCPVIVIATFFGTPARTKFRTPVVVENHAPVNQLGFALRGRSTRPVEQRLVCGQIDYSFPLAEPDFNTAVVPNLTEVAHRLSGWPSSFTR